MTGWAWEGEHHVRVGGVRFFVGTTPIALEPDDLHVIKPPAMAARYLDLLASEGPARVVELGIKDGGSTALIAAVAPDARVLGVDLAPAVPERLAALLARDPALAARVAVSPGLDQADRGALVAAVDAAFGPEPIDLVFDDASHILGPTRASFEVLFPRLRPGGLFVIEDWQMELIATAAVSRFHPDSPPTELQPRVAALSSVLRTLNDPESELPPAVVTALTEAGQAALAEPDAPRDLFSLLARAVDRAGIEPPPGPPARPMADLAVELAVLAATRPDLVADLRVDADWLTVRRGPAELGTDELVLDDAWADVYGYLRGRDG